MSRIIEDNPAYWGNDSGGGAPPRRRLRIPGQSWLQLIQADPRYRAHQSALAGESSAQGARRQAAVRAALLHLGMTPDLQAALRNLGLGHPGGTAGDSYGQWLNQDVNQGVLDQAGANQFSFTNMEGRQHDQNLTSLQDVLAAKVMLRSGQTGYETGNENLRHTGAINDAVQNLLGFLSGQYGDFATGEAGRATDLGNYGDYVSGLLQDEGTSPAASPGEAQFDPTSGLFYLNGKYYNESGQPVNYQAPAAPPLPPAGAPAPVQKNYRAHRRRAYARRQGYQP
jgi:hypothetical protein